MAKAIFSLPPDLQFLTERQVSDLTGRALQTLRNDRHHSRGFPYIKFGRQIRYKLSDIVATMAAHRVVPGGNGGGHE